MGSFADQEETVTPLHIGTWSLYSVGAVGRAYGLAVPAVITWAGSGTATYVPLVLPFPYIVRRLWWANGSTVTSCNADVGIYTASGARLVSGGGTALSGASVLQYVDTTDILLSPGRYYIGCVFSGTLTSRAFGIINTAVNGQQTGILQQASAYPLPATMTPASYNANGLPLCGITRTASGF